MQKFAHLVKTAEIRGVMAYLVDSEMVKVASEEDFDALVNEVADAIGDEQYDLNTVLNKTAEIIEGSQEKEPAQKEEKTAETQELSKEDVEREIGKLTMSKMAGEISDEEFEKEASRIQQARQAVEATGKRARDVAGRGRQAVEATGRRAGDVAVRGGRAYTEALRGDRGGGRQLAAVAAPGAVPGAVGGSLDLIRRRRNKAE